MAAKTYYYICEYPEMGYTCCLGFLPEYPFFSVKVYQKGKGKYVVNVYNAKRNTRRRYVVGKARYQSLKNLYCQALYFDDHRVGYWGGRSGSFEIIITPYSVISYPSRSMNVYNKIFDVYFREVRIGDSFEIATRFFREDGEAEILTRVHEQAKLFHVNVTAYRDVLRNAEPASPVSDFRLTTLYYAAYGSKKSEQDDSEALFEPCTLEEFKHGVLSVFSSYERNRPLTLAHVRTPFPGLSRQEFDSHLLRLLKLRQIELSCAERPTPEILAAGIRNGPDEVLALMTVRPAFQLENVPF